ILVFRRRTLPAIVTFASLQFLAFNRSHRFHDRLWIRHNREHVFIQNADATGSDGAHGEFFVAGDAEFAHNKNVERNTEPPRDLKSDWDTASRKAENDDVIASG